MKVLDLFSGIGTFSLGLERAGMETVAFCELEPFCRQVLRRHWPTVPIYEDVRTLTAETLSRDGIAVDVIAGGFPCQDISRAGTGAGLEGDRSGLWYEYARLIGEIRPQFVIVENVAALLDRDGPMGAVLGSLAKLGYDAEWSSVSACAVGHTHMRPRVFLVAYPNSEHGRPRLRDTAARSNGTLQTRDSYQSARARARSRLANPSELYRGAVELTEGPQRNRAIGNAIAPEIAELIGAAILGTAA